MRSASDQVRLGAAVLVAGLLLAACGDDGGAASDDAATDEAPAQAGETITVPTGDWRPGDPGGRALLEGRLDMSDPACPMVVAGGDEQAGGAATTVVWPAGAYVAADSGQYGLYAEDGDLLAVDGDRLTLSGSAGTDPVKDCGEPDGEVFLVEADIEIADK